MEMQYLIREGTDVDDPFFLITQQLRDPVTSVRLVSEILHDNESMDIHQRKEFLTILLKEAEKLAGLINQASVVLNPQTSATHLNFQMANSFVNH